MLNFIKRLVHEEEGQGMVEYGLILALLSVAAILIIGPIGTKVTAAFSSVLTNWNAVD